jgi:hypothetical protein
MGWWENKKHTFRLVGWKFIGLSIFRKPYRSPHIGPANPEQARPLQFSVERLQDFGFNSQVFRNLTPLSQ